MRFSDRSHKMPYLIAYSIMQYTIFTLQRTTFIRFLLRRNSDVTIFLTYDIWQWYLLDFYVLRYANFVPILSLLVIKYCCCSTRDFRSSFFIFTSCASHLPNLVIDTIILRNTNLFESPFYLNINWMIFWMKILRSCRVTYRKRGSMYDRWTYFSPIGSFRPFGDVRGKANERKRCGSRQHPVDRLGAVMERGSEIAIQRNHPNCTSWQVRESGQFQCFVLFLTFPASMSVVENKIERAEPLTFSWLGLISIPYIHGDLKARWHHFFDSISIGPCLQYLNLF